MAEFKVGDIVRTKLPGPDMVVKFVYDNSWIGRKPTYLCQWFNKHDNLCEETFEEGILIGGGVIDGPANNRLR